MEADFRDLLVPPPEQPEISNINNVLSIQPLPQAPLAADEYVSNFHIPHIFEACFTASLTR